MEDCYIIAEIGSNCLKYKSEEKNLQLAKEQIAAAKACGADAAKFQLFTYQELYGLSAPEDYKERYELPKHWIPTLKEFCQKFKIDFMCSAFSVYGYKFIDEHVNTHKIASPEAASKNLVSAVQSMGNPIFISNGCLTYEEQCELAGADSWGADDIMLECVSNYPASIYDYDFSRITQLARDYRLHWGLSDHTTGSAVAMQARSLGARVFEKHVDLAAISAPNTPDTCVSMERREFESYCSKLKSYKPYQYDRRKRTSKELYGRDASGFRPLPQES